LAAGNSWRSARMGLSDAGMALTVSGGSSGASAGRAWPGSTALAVLLDRAEFLRQCHAAVDAAHDPAGYRQLQRLLRAWRLTAIAASRAGYYEEIAAVRSSTVLVSPAEEDVPGWQERLAQRKSF
jgi:hypothetical protein